MNKQTKKGFTLVELVIVIAVIAILSAVLIPVFGNVISDAKLSAAKSSVSNAISQFTIDQAAAGNDASLGDGYIYVFDNAVGHNNTTKPANIFKFQGGELQDSDKSFDELANYKLDGEFNPVIEGDKVTSYTITDTADKLCAIPLNAEFTVDDSATPATATVSATIWLVYEHTPAP